jgi:hypothetical protein
LGATRVSKSRIFEPLGACTGAARSASRASMEPTRTATRATPTDSVRPCPHAALRALAAALGRQAARACWREQANAMDAAPVSDGERGARDE